MEAGRQGYVLGSGDLRFQASSSHCPCPVSMVSSGGSKKSRVDEGEVWTGASSFGNDSWRSFSGEPSQMPLIQGIQRPKRQNCASLVQGHWDAMNGIHGCQDEMGSGSNRTSMDIEGNLGRCSRSGFTGFHGLTEQGLRKTNFDFFQTGPGLPGSGSSSSFLPSWTAGNASGETLLNPDGTLLEDRVDSWNAVAALHSGAIRPGDLGSVMACHFDGSSMVNFPQNTVDAGFLMEYRNTDVLGPVSGNVGEQSGSSEAIYRRATNINLERSALEGSCGLDPSTCAYSSSLLGSGGGTAPFPISGLVGSSMNNSGSLLGHTSSGRRSSCKRKSSMAGITGPLSFRAPQSSDRWEGNFTRSTGGSGLSRSDVGNPICAASDVFHSAASAPMIPVWDDRHNLRAGLVSNDNDNVPESLRVNAGKSALLSGATGSSSRNIRSRSLCTQQEQSRSQLHPPFVRNTRRSLPTLPSQAWISRPNGAVNGTVAHEAENWSASAFNQRSGTSSFVGCWGGNNTFPRTNNNYSNFSGSSREIASGIFEGNQTRNLSTGASTWLGVAAIENRVPNQATFDSASRAVTASTSRPYNARESHSHVSQVGASSFVYPGSAATRSSPHLSAGLSNRRNTFPSQGCMLPPATTSAASNHTVPGSLGVSLEAYPSSASLYGPCPSAMRPSLFVNGAGEANLASSVQSLLGMPFRGLQILPAEGGNRHRFVSEELMLDQSLVFNGVDMHDQHSDMRLDVDNMSYEELLALEESIGNVSTGLGEEAIAKCLKISKYSSLDATVAAISQESEIKCSICQEEYEEEDELGRLYCGHSYHTACIKQWLVQKNQCPICKTAAHSKP